MKVARLCRRPFVGTAFTGEGARRSGGRWNPRGIRVAYCASHLSLSALEMLVHVDPDDAPDDLVALEATVPDEVVERLDVGTLAADWRAVPAPEALRDVGEAWVRSARSFALLVPSAIVPSEDNVLLNPAHPDAARLTVVAERPFTFDPRLWKVAPTARMAPPARRRWRRRRRRAALRSTSRRTKAPQRRVLSE